MRRRMIAGLVAGLVVGSMLPGAALAGRAGDCWPFDPDIPDTVAYCRTADASLPDKSALDVLDISLPDKAGDARDFDWDVHVQEQAIAPAVLGGEPPTAPGAAPGLQRTH